MCVFLFCLKKKNLKINEIVAIPGVDYWRRTVRLAYGDRGAAAGRQSGGGGEARPLLAQ